MRKAATLTQTSVVVFSIWWLLTQTQATVSIDRGLPLYPEMKAAPTAALFLRFCNQTQIWKGSFFGHKPTHMANLSIYSPPSQPRTERKVLWESSGETMYQYFCLHSKI